MVARAVTYKFTVEEYNRLAELGFFRRDERVELIEGEIVRMAPIGSRHYNAVDRLNALFATLAVARRAIVSIQNPVVLDEHSKPQPDVVLKKYADDFYRAREPGPADVWLLIEVADSSLEYDQFTKLPLYARALIPEVWIVDLVLSEIEVYRDPKGDTYAEKFVLKRGDTVSPQAFPDIVARVEDVIG